MEKRKHLKNKTGRNIYFKRHVSSDVDTTVLAKFPRNGLKSETGTKELFAAAKG